MSDSVPHRVLAEDADEAFTEELCRLRREHHKIKSYFPIEKSKDLIVCALE